MVEASDSSLSNRKMNKNSSNISQILTSFDTFVNIVEDPNWVRCANVEDIKTAFKLGAFVEKTIENFTSTSALQEFLNLLKTWWNKNNRLKVYEEGFFRLACDRLLARFFKEPNMPENSLDIAVRVYTSMYPKERMRSFIMEIILISSSVEAMWDFVLNSNNTNVKYIEYKLKLSNWRELAETCRENAINNEIHDILTFKLESCLYLLVGVLSLKNVAVIEKHVQDIVLKSLLEKMLNRTQISKQFWVTFFKRVDVDLVSLACNNFKEFLESFLNFVVYCGSMLKKEGESWKSDANITVCPEIGYRDLVIHLKDLIRVNPELKKVVCQLLQQAKENATSNIWDQIITEM